MSMYSLLRSGRVLCWCQSNNRSEQVSKFNKWFCKSHLRQIETDPKELNPMNRYICTNSADETRDWNRPLRWCKSRKCPFKVVIIVGKLANIMYFMYLSESRTGIWRVFMSLLSHKYMSSMLFIKITSGLLGGGGRSSRLSWSWKLDQSDVCYA